MHFHTKNISFLFFFSAIIADASQASPSQDEPPKEITKKPVSQLSDLSSKKDQKRIKQLRKAGFSNPTEHRRIEKINAWLRYGKMPDRKQ